MNVELRMVVESSGGNFGDVNFTLHRLTNDWGEGTTVGALEGGFGGSPAMGDATWSSNFHNVSTWASNGGDYIATPSAVQSAGQAGDLVVWSDPYMVADVQGWVDGTLPNNGWIVLSAIEGTKQRAKKFYSSEASVNRPMIVVTADLAAAVPGIGPYGMMLIITAIGVAGVLRAGVAGRRKP